MQLFAIFGFKTPRKYISRLFYVRTQKKHCIKLQALHRRQKQGGIYRETCNVFRTGVCVVQHQIPVAVYVPVFSGYPDFGTSRAYRRVFDGTDFGLSCYHYKMFAEIPAFFNVFRGGSDGYFVGHLFRVAVVAHIQQQKEQKNRAFGACRRLFDGNGYVDYRQPFYLDSVLCRGNVQGELGRLT